MAKKYKLYHYPDKLYGSIWLVDKEKLPADWDALLITSNRNDYNDELVHVMKVSILPDQTFEIDPENYGKMEYNRIKDTCTYLYTAGKAIMKQLI